MDVDYHLYSETSGSEIEDVALYIETEDMEPRQILPGEYDEFDRPAKSERRDPFSDDKPHTSPLRERVHEQIVRNMWELECGRPGHEVILDWPFQTEIEVTVAERWLVDVITRRAAADELPTELELLVEASRTKYSEV